MKSSIPAKPRAAPELVFRSGMLHLGAPADFDPEGELGLKGWTWDGRFGRWSAFAVDYSAFRDAARRASLRVDDRVGRSWSEVALSSEGAVELRSYQSEAVRAWEGFGRRGLVVLPTGMGKTEIALEIMRRTRAATLVVAPVKCSAPAKIGQVRE